MASSALEKLQAKVCIIGSGEQAVQKAALEVRCACHQDAAMPNLMTPGALIAAPLTLFACCLVQVLLATLQPSMPPAQVNRSSQSTAVLCCFNLLHCFACATWCCLLSAWLRCDALYQLPP